MEIRTRRSGPLVFAKKKLFKGACPGHVFKHYHNEPEGHCLPLTYNNGEGKMIKALKTIAEYIEKKKPKTLAEANHMLALIGIIAAETVIEVEAEQKKL